MLYQIDEENSYVVFKLGETFFGIRSKYIQQMEMVENITPVPKVPSYVDGVTLSRGKVIPVINLRERLGMERIPYDIKTRMIVVKLENRELGIIVDTAREYIPQFLLRKFKSLLKIFLEFLIDSLKGLLILEIG